MPALYANVVYGGHTNATSNWESANGLLLETVLSTDGVSCIVPKYTDVFRCSKWYGTINIFKEDCRLCTQCLDSLGVAATNITIASASEVETVLVFLWIQTIEIGAAGVDRRVCFILVEIEVWGQNAEKHVVQYCGSESSVGVESLNGTIPVVGERKYYIGNVAGHFHILILVGNLRHERRFGNGQSELCSFPGARHRLKVANQSVE